jgi:three-Cys-motif partner protein
MSSYIEIKAHSLIKYQILRNYLGVCQRFEDYYHNFAYIDTHGGSGQVLDLTDNSRKAGSVLTAAQIQPSFPCYAVEIDDLRFALLNDSARTLKNVELHKGDCNELIHKILLKIERGKRFVFCFIDPCGLVYQSDGKIADQLRFETVEAVAGFPRSEILLNFPIEAIMQTSGVVHSMVADRQTVATMSDHLNKFFGSEDWHQVDPGDYRGFLKTYLECVKRVAPNYRYRGAILIRSDEKNAPQYYLVYFSQHIRGGKIMRDIMEKQWRDITGAFPLTRHKYPTINEWREAEYPVEKPFIFED